MSSTTFIVDAVLFDMDGTLVDSTKGVEGAWNLFAQSYPGIDVTNILSSSHGIRTIDNLRKHCPSIQDDEELEREASRFEEAIISTSSGGIEVLPGVVSLFEEIGSGGKLPNPYWAICTSATRSYASAAVKSAGVPIPDVFVVAEDVSNGKPFPDPFLLGAKLCGADPTKCVVFEDSPNGVRSGKAAGCKTIGLLTTHSKDHVLAANPDFLIQDMSSVTIKRTSAGVEITIYDLQ